MSRIALALTAVVVVAGCTSTSDHPEGAPQPAGSSAPPSPQTPATTTSAPAVPANTQVCQDDAHDTGGIDLLQGQVSARGRYLTWSVTTRKPIPLKDFGAILDVRDASGNLHYWVRINYENGERTGFYVDDQHGEQQTDLDEPVTVSGSTLTTRVRFKDLPGISRDSFRWAVNVDQTAKKWTLDNCPSQPWFFDADQVVDFADRVSTPIATPPAELPVIEHGQATQRMATAEVRKREVVGFLSPSGNLNCYMWWTGAECSIGQFSWKMPPRPKQCFGDWASQIEVTSGRAMIGLCRTDADPGGPKLPYGHGYDVGVFRCVSETDGVRCENRRTGHGFWISRTHNDTY